MKDISSEDSSNSERVWIWEQGLNKFKEHPISGLGKGQFGSHNSSGLIAHSNYLQNFVEVGFFGFYFWIGVLYFSFKGLFLILLESSKEIADKGFNNLAFGAFLSYVGFCIVTIFITMELLFLYVLWGTYAAIISIGKKKYAKINFNCGPVDLLLIALISIFIIFVYHLQTTYNLI